MSTKRQYLGAYPCPIGIDTWCNAECAEAIDNCEAVMCRWLPIYRAHITLRADMRKLRAAVLGNLPREVAAYIYRNAAQLYGERANEEAKARFMALADVVAKL